MPASLALMVNVVLAQGQGGTDGGQHMPGIQLPAFKKKRKTWNKMRMIGQKRPLSVENRVIVLIFKNAQVGHLC